ncbi:MAG: alcohol dehydrogenase catalytic domain-containing protein [Opitutales bacterium]|nr:alcohol dehydrogenase catalytic domain-containing protein [Opitutales bacterium]
MKALLYPELDQLEFVALEQPTPTEDEVLIKVAACGICGSELETFKNQSPRRKPPLIMGHEFCGTIVSVGAQVDVWKAGDAVVAHAIVHCGDCDCCGRGDDHLCRNREVFGMHRPGAFAGYVCVPQKVLLPWPSNLAAAEACLAEPLANGVHVADLLKPYAPAKCLVVGAGPIGLMCLQALRVSLGAEVCVSDLSEERLEVARRLGAARTLQPDCVEASVDEWSAGEGLDCIVDAVGSAATKRQSLSLLRPGGVAVWLGLHQDRIELDSYGLTLPEVAVLGSYSARLDELRVALGWMAKGRVDVRSWVDIYPLADGVHAFRRMMDAQGEAIKAVLTPEHSDL